MKKADLKQFFRNKTVRIVLICLVAFLLLIAVWRVFFTSTSSVGAGNVYQPTDRETRISVLLSRIEGVDGATVMITEEDGTPVGAVIVFEGAGGFVTRMRVIEATATALAIPPEKVLVYPA